MSAKNVSETALSAILRERDERPLASVVDLYRRTPVWRAALENMIGAGFLDCLRPRRDRAALLGETSVLPCPPVH